MTDWIKTVRDFREHLRIMQSPALRGTWTADDDLALVVGVLQGNGFAGAVRATGRDETQCRGRWAALYPEEIRMIDRQRVLLQLIRANAKNQPATAQVEWVAP